MNLRLSDQFLKSDFKQITIDPSEFTDGDMHLQNSLSFVAVHQLFHLSYQCRDKRSFMHVVTRANDPLTSDPLTSDPLTSDPLAAKAQMAESQMAKRQPGIATAVRWAADDRSIEV